MLLGILSIKVKAHFSKKKTKNEEEKENEELIEEKLEIN